MTRSLAFALFGTLATACASAVKGTPAAPTLTARSDSFAISVRGRVVGSQTATLERTPEGWLFTDATVLPGVRQVTEVRASRAGAVEHMHQRDQRGAMVAVSDLTYAGGRITGTIQLPAQEGTITTLAIDTVAVAGVIDDNFAAALEPSFPWAPEARIGRPVFVGGKNVTQQWTYHVERAETITVPAGTFQAYRVAVEGGPTSLVMWVEAAAPHRVLERAPAGSPLEIVRIR